MAPRGPFSSSPRTLRRGPLHARHQQAPRARSRSSPSRPPATATAARPCSRTSPSSPAPTPNREGLGSSSTRSRASSSAWPRARDDACDKHDDHRRRRHDEGDPVPGLEQIKARDRGPTTRLRPREAPRSGSPKLAGGVGPRSTVGARPRGRAAKEKKARVEDALARHRAASPTCIGPRRRRVLHPRPRAVEAIKRKKAVFGKATKDVTRRRRPPSTIRRRHDVVYRPSRSTQTIADNAGVKGTVVVARSARERARTLRFNALTRVRRSLQRASSPRRRSTRMALQNARAWRPSARRGLHHHRASPREGRPRATHTAPAAEAWANGWHGRRHGWDGRHGRYGLLVRAEARMCLIGAETWMVRIQRSG
jgi:hypothetical protein